MGAVQLNLLWLCTAICFVEFNLYFLSWVLRCNHNVFLCSAASNSLTLGESSARDRSEKRLFPFT